jgi:hypothetical protein
VTLHPASDAPPEIVRPGRLWSRNEILVRPCPVPATDGVYAWYFRQVPPRLVTAGCERSDGLTLLYVGIAPKRPPANTGRPSRQTLRSRVSDHYRGNAEGSTLRLTLGCLLRDQLGLCLYRVGTGRRMTFSDGEEALSVWMGANAYVCWLETSQPWTVESEIIGAVNLPLNLDQNQHSPNYEVVREARRSARELARTLPVRRS